MNKLITFLFFLSWTSQVVLGAELTTPIQKMTPEDVVQDSIRVLRMGTNKFTVFFTYTERGAEKMLAFSEAHAGERTRTQVGDFLLPEGVCYAPRDPTEYASWREGWLKRRTSKFFGVSAADADAIVAGLEGKPTK
jgi:hypothetical protein